MNKDKIYAYIEDLEDKAKASDRFFQERNDLYIENQQLKKQKDDVVDFIHKELDRFDCEGSMSISMRISYFEEELLRMLGEIE